MSGVKVIVTGCLMSDTSTLNQVNSFSVQTETMSSSLKLEFFHTDLCGG